jgi:chromosome segregation protein
MDKGAHFHKYDFQVHTPRDLNWQGVGAITDEERSAYAQEFVVSCRSKGLHAVAITDHHDLALFRFIRSAAETETAADGSPLDQAERLTVFPGVGFPTGCPFWP